MHAKPVTKFYIKSGKYIVILVIKKAIVIC